MLADDQVSENLGIVSWLSTLEGPSANMLEIKNGDPFGHDPLVIARTMAQHGIVLVSSMYNSIRGRLISVHGSMRRHTFRVQGKLAGPFFTDS